ncbi:MAG: C-terminal binding protein [Propionibacteriaceae bacterium]|jgi:D-3-phosphoglycerate dehydrogenase|nr:C-terminal binding protein [Propionibacteriaceae bacterium]
MSIPKAVYFNVDDTLEYENSLLEKWGVAGQLELVEAKPGSNSDAAYIEAMQGAQGSVVEYFEVTEPVLAALPDLQVVSLQAIGYSNVDAAAATKYGVALTNSPGFCSEEVALHTVGLLIDLVRKLSFLDRSVRAGKWDPILGPMPQRITGKRIGLVFFGSIPKKMVPILKAIGLEVAAYAPTKTAAYLDEFGVVKVETLDELLATSDFISMHTPLKAETRHLIGAREFALMKPSAFFLNTARGAVVDEAALVAALKSGQIAGAGIDVIEDEDTEQSELFGLENVVITPHAAFVSEQSFAQAREMALSQLVQVLVEKRRPDYLVNTDVKIKGIG